VDECPYCHTYIIWEGSRLWIRTFGSVDKAKRRLTIFPPDEDDGIGRVLMESAGLDGFANESELRRWKRAKSSHSDGTRYIEDDEILLTIRYVESRTAPRGRINHVLNILDKKWRTTRKQIRTERKKREKAEKEALLDIKIEV
jgi:hypothetical protein